MKPISMAACGLSALAVAACGPTYEDVVPVTPPDYTATADLRDASGRSMGSASAAQVGDSIRVRIEAMNMPAGAHGAHIHMTGTCVGSDFASAGGHWNPSGVQHGKDNPAGMHMGDLPNLLVGADGSGILEYSIPNARVAGRGDAMLDSDGAALVIHATADDYRSDPSGNSGSRIACGVFR